MTYYDDMVAYGVRRPRPKGIHTLAQPQSVADMSRTKRYRVPHSDKGHLLNPTPTEDPVFYCGLSPWLDEQWLADTGYAYENYYGQYWIVEDTRDGNVCTPCKQWREKLAIPLDPPKKKLSPMEQLAEKKRNQQVHRIAVQLGAVIVDD